MVGARQAAIGAAEVLAAGPAEQHRGVAAPVAQQDRLTAGGEGGIELVEQSRGEEHLAGPAGRPLLAQVDEDPLRQASDAHALGQAEAHQPPAIRGQTGLEAGGGGDQHRHRAGGACPYQGQVPAVIARRRLLLVGEVLLLVHHHQPELRDRREDRRARPHHHARLAAPHALPLLVPLGAAQTRMQDRRALAEALGHFAGEGGDERDLGHQQQHRSARLEGGLRGAQIDLGLARSGHPLEQDAREAARSDRRAHGLEGRALVGAQLARPGARRGLRRQQVPVEPQAAGLREAAQQAEARQPAHHRVGGSGVLAQLRYGGRAAEGSQVLEDSAARCRAPAADELVRELPRGALHGSLVAPAPSLRLARGEPALRDQPLEAGRKVRLLEVPQQLRQGPRPAGQEEVAEARLEAVPGWRQGPRVGERDAPVAPGRQVLRQHRSDHLADRRQVVLAGEAGELEQIGGQDRLQVAQGRDVARRHAIGRGLDQPPQHAGDVALADRHAHALTGSRARHERRRNRVGERPGQRQRDGDLGEGGARGRPGHSPASFRRRTSPARRATSG